MDIYPPEDYVREQIKHVQDQIEQLRNELPYADDERFMHIVYQLHDLGRMLERFKGLRGSGGKHHETTK